MPTAVTDLHPAVASQIVEEIHPGRPAAIFNQPTASRPWAAMTTAPRTHVVCLADERIPGLRRSPGAAGYHRLIIPEFGDRARAPVNFIRGAGARHHPPLTYGAVS